mgnify:CR=1 FL=1
MHMAVEPAAAVFLHKAGEFPMESPQITAELPRLPGRGFFAVRHTAPGAFVQQAMSNHMRVKMQEQSQARRALEQQKRRISEIDGIIKRLYEDNISGKLTDERFAKMSADYEREQASLRESVEELRKTVETCERQSVNMDSFLKLVKKYTVPDKLFPELLNAFVEKIVVHAPDKSSGHRTQQIDIHYNFIGEIGLSHIINKKEPTRYADNISRRFYQTQTSL